MGGLAFSFTRRTCSFCRAGSWFVQFPREISPSPCRLSHPEKEQISAQIGALKETYQALCSDSTEQLQQLQSQLAQETEHKVLVRAQSRGCTDAGRSSGCEKGFAWLRVSWPPAAHSPSTFLLARGCPPFSSVHASPEASRLGWSLEAKQEPFTCCLPGQWESCPLQWFSSELCPVHEGWLVHAWWART